MSADDNRTPEMVGRIPRALVVPFIAGLITTILLCGVMLYSQRDRFDGTVYLWGAILIAGIFVISIPLAVLQKRSKERALHRPPFRPWPQSISNPLFGKPVALPGLRLAGRFNWTPDAFARLSKDWRRYTPAGKRYRRMILGLTSIGLVGISLAALFLWQREWSAIALILASAVLLLFAYDCRIRALREVRSQAQVRWELSPDQLLIGSEENEKIINWSGVHAILQTPAGFLLWPENFIEVLLPASAFGNERELSLFAELAQSSVRNFVRVD